MSLIFVSYRQRGTLMRTGRIADALVERFGDINVFQDRATLHGGINWRRAIDAALEDCRVLIAVIGPDWLEHQDATGARRIDDEADYVRYEIATALQRGIPIIPVLVNGAVRMREHQLPDPIKDLAYIEPLTINDDDWRGGVRSLLDALKRFQVQRRVVEVKTIVALVLAVIGMLAAAPDVVPPIAASVGMATGLVSMVLSFLSFRANRGPRSTDRPDKRHSRSTLPFSEARRRPFLPVRSRAARAFRNRRPASFPATIPTFATAPRTGHERLRSARRSRPLETSLR